MNEEQNTNVVSKSENSGLLGLIAAAILWGVMIICHLIDQFLIHEFALSMIMLFFAPLALLIWYVWYCMKQEHGFKSLLVWHLCYSGVFFVVWAVAYFVTMITMVFSSPGGDTISLLGGGITWYGLTGLFAFTILSLLFHGGRALVRLFTKKKI